MYSRTGSVTLEFIRDVANVIQGHSAGDEASKYGSSELLSRKREAAEQVWKLSLLPK
jgi:hypothetical protein